MIQQSEIEQSVNNNEKANNNHNITRYEIIFVEKRKLMKGIVGNYIKSETIKHTDYKININYKTSKYHLHTMISTWIHVHQN